MTAAISAKYLFLNGNSMSYQCCLKQEKLIETQSELFSVNIKYIKSKSDIH